MSIDLTVEAAFGYGFGDDPVSYVWVDVTDYVEAGDEVDIQRGRGDEFSEMQPSVINLTLDNRDGRFTPEYAAGAYYPDVKMRTPLRVTCTYDAVAYDLGFGFVDQWPVVWPGGTDTFATSAISAHGTLPRLNSTFRGLTAEEMLRDTPVAFYPMSEASTQDEAVNAATREQPNLAFEPGSGGSVILGNASAVTTDDLTTGGVSRIVNQPGAGPFVRSTTGLVASTDPGFSIAFVYGTAVAPTTGDATIVALRDAAVRISNEINGAGTVTVNGGAPAGVGGGNDVYVETFNLTAANTTGLLKAIITTGGTKTTQSTGIDITDGSAIHVVHVTVTRTAGTSTPRYYLDGVLAYTGATFADHPGDLDLLVMGAQIDDNAGSMATGICNLGVWNTVLSPARIADHAEAALTGFVGDSSDERFARFAAYAGATVTTEAGTSTSIPLLKTDNRNRMDLLNTITKGEGGLLFEGTDGSLVFQARTHRPSAATVITLSAAAQEIGVDFAPTYDDFGMVNDCSATSTEEGVQAARSVDATSIDTYGLYATSEEIPTTSAEEVAGFAQWTVAKRANPKVRVRSVTVDVGNLADTQIPALLALEISDRIVLTDLPEQAPASELMFFVEGIKRSVSVNGDHRLTLALSPAFQSDAWVLDSTLNSVLDSTTFLSY